MKVEAPESSALKVGPQAFSRGEVVKTDEVILDHAQQQP